MPHEDTERLRLGESRPEVSLLLRLHWQQRAFQDHERMLPQVSGLVHASHRRAHMPHLVRYVGYSAAASGRTVLA